MATATIIVTKRNIAEREAKISQLRAAASSLPKNSPKRQQVRKAVEQLLQEVAALKASLHYYRPTAELKQTIAQQRLKVKALTEEFSTNKSLGLGRQLRKEAKCLNEMLAAAKLQQVKTGVNSPLPRKKPGLTLLRQNPDPDFPDGFPDEVLKVEQEQTAPKLATPDEALAAEGVGFQPSDFSTAALAKLEDGMDELDEYINEDGEVWYKNPVVLVGAGVAAWLILRRRD